MSTSVLELHIFCICRLEHLKKLKLETFSHCTPYLSLSFDLHQCLVLLHPSLSHFFFTNFIYLTLFIWKKEIKSFESLIFSVEGYLLFMDLPQCSSGPSWTAVYCSSSVSCTARADNVNLFLPVFKSLPTFQLLL